MVCTNQVLWQSRWCVETNGIRPWDPLVCLGSSLFLDSLHQDNARTVWLTTGVAGQQEWLDSRSGWTAGVAGQQEWPDDRSGWTTCVARWRPVQSSWISSNFRMFADSRTLTSTENRVPVPRYRVWVPQPQLRVVTSVLRYFHLSYNFVSNFFFISFVILNQIVCLKPPRFICNFPLPVTYF